MASVRPPGGAPGSVRIEEGGSDYAAIRVGNSREISDTRPTAALVHGSRCGYLMRTEGPLPEVSTDEVPEANRRVRTSPSDKSTRPMVGTMWWSFRWPHPCSF
jgi:hypothetical protein